MPSHKVHRAIEKKILGKTFEPVHRFKDAPAQQIPGPRHRQYRHDTLSNAIMAAQMGDPNAFLAGELHDILDRTVSAMPPTLKKLLEVLVN